MKTLRIVTLNIWNRSGPWEQRLPLIRAELERLRPDLVGLNEVMRMESLGICQATELAAGLGAQGLHYEVAYGPALDAGNGLYMGNAILSRHPLVDVGHAPLPVFDETDGRSVVFARARTPHGDVPFFVTHLSWELHLSSTRVRQVRALVAELDRLRSLRATSGDDLPAVVCGDFNADPSADEIRYMTGRSVQGGHSTYFADAYEWRGADAGHTWCERNPFTAPVLGPDRRIDYIFVRGPDDFGRGRVLNAQVVCDGANDAGVYPSDHFGVLTDLQATGD